MVKSLTGTQTNKQERKGGTRSFSVVGGDQDVDKEKVGYKLKPWQGVKKIGGDGYVDGCTYVERERSEMRTFGMHYAVREWGRWVWYGLGAGDRRWGIVHVERRLCQ